MTKGNKSRPSNKGLLPTTKYQTAAGKGSMKTYCKGHESLLYCKVLGRFNTEIFTISSYNDDRIKNRQD